MDETITALQKKVRNYRILLIVAIIASYFVFFQNTPDLARNQSHVAVYKVYGDLNSADEHIEILSEIARNQNAKALVLRVNSPGGTFYSGERLHRAISSIQKSKPVVVVMEDQATSAAYMISTPADRIFALNSTQTGSIGVLIAAYDYVELANKIGITPYIIKTAPLKALGNGSEKLSSEGQQFLKAQIAEAQQHFVNMVIANRPIEKEEIHAIANGAVYQGSKALQLKLIDEIGDIDDALLWLQQEKQISHPTSEYSRHVQKSWLAELTGDLAKAVSQAFLHALGQHMNATQFVLR